MPPDGLKPGDRGPQVAALEQALDSRRFFVNRVDDHYDDDTSQAVVAFQKLAGLPRTGRATPDVVERLGSQPPPTPVVSGGGPNRVEIDLARQLLFLWRNDTLARVLPVSTANGERFCSEGWCRRAVTPTGAYQVYQRVNGWQKSPLGRLYNPVYFNEGIAIHGYQSVPPNPASHGCVRIPMAAAQWFPNEAPEGTPVYVWDGQNPVAPLPPPPGAPPPPPPPPPPAPPPPPPPPPGQ